MLGNRVYYKRRSQPPLFISMVEAYYDSTKDLEFIENNIDYLEQEFQHWMQNRSVTITKDGKDYTLARYNVEVDSPRPESYYEDYVQAQNFDTIEVIFLVNSIDVDYLLVLILFLLGTKGILQKHEIRSREWMGLFYQMVF